ncbi:hypothetical protein RvY_10457 [Ramazzottius varieornatus]|uniref:Uncharacterized protein n=1 Tax=Ramazzottius varieornatus TaxID=947166 RepID=A0A1D1VF92_RAMVA|nr:hypothetical protein RvY_10457 [Ramazzottius varieornatus]
MEDMRGNHEEHSLRYILDQNLKKTKDITKVTTSQMDTETKVASTQIFGLSSRSSSSESGRHEMTLLGLMQSPLDVSAAESGKKVPDGFNSFHRLPDAKDKRTPGELRNCPPESIPSQFSQ